MNPSDIFKVPTSSSSSKKRQLPSPSSSSSSTTTNSKSTNEAKKAKFDFGVTIEDADIDDNENGIDDEDERFLHGSGLSAKQQEIYEIVDTVEEAPSKIDLSTLKKLVLKLERSINKNTELRLRYPTDPLKFIDSETDLDESIHELMKVSSVPEYYQVLVELGCVGSMVGLITHDNSDISIATLRLVNELTDEDVVEVSEGEEGELGMKALVAGLVENQLFETLVENLNRFNEADEDSDDRQGVFTSLNIIENVLSIDPSLSEVLTTKTTILAYLLNRIKQKQFDSNKEYAGEVLSILLQSSHVVREKVVEMGGVGDLLNVLSAFRKRDPKEMEEIEMMENFFDSICCLVGGGEKRGRVEFLNGEGVELMVIMLREKKMSRMRALKVLSFAMAGEDSSNVCNRFIEQMGLKLLFAIFMKKGLKAYKKLYKNHSDKEEEEHAVSILSSLCRNATGDQRIRLYIKFADNNCEALDRLFDLHNDYYARVLTAGAVSGQQGPGEDEDEDEEEITPEQRYLDRLEKGLFTLQLADLVLAYVNAEDPVARGHLKLLLQRRKGSYQQISDILKEYAENLGDESDSNPERLVVLDLIESLNREQ
ncbi:hypothetical protein HDU76_011239 [Blyttiomyces sp. JEL0837]|nr:hypothetical protein HDU76_011239 [Blyttiomyces sp. JEL0837]